MFHRTLLIAILALYAAAEEQPLPRVHLLATGGTIAGGADGALSAEQLAEALPAIATIAELSVEDFVRIGSSRMTPEIQFRLANRVNELFAADPGLAGIIITHGTDSLEETAFFVDLLLADRRPVIFAAAQRPPRETDTDGPRNLLNAIRLAASPRLVDFGVVVTLNDEIHAARDVRKTHSVAVQAFSSDPFGPVGYVDGDRIALAYKPLRRLTLSPGTIEPNVDLVHLTAGSNGRLIRAAVASGAKGIVVEVFGRGNVPELVAEAIREAIEQGVVVAFTTRTGAGRVTLYPPFDDMGVISAQDLDGLKARIVLIAALGETRDIQTLSDYYRALGGLTAQPGPAEE